MRKIPATFQILSDLDGTDILRRLELAARTCYKSEDRATGDPRDTERFISRILGAEHESVIEHCGATVRVTCDRGISHEIVRHRLLSYCVSGDTVLRAFQSPTGGAKTWTVGQLYVWQFDPKRKSRLRLIRLRSVAEDNTIVAGSIKKILYSGEQPTLQVSLRSGRQMRVTENHRVKTPQGWRPAGQLQVGDGVYANGRSCLDDHDWLYNKYITENHTLVEMAQLTGWCTTIVTRALRQHGINKPLSLRKNRQPGRGRKMTAAEKQAVSERMSGAGNYRWAGDDVGRSGGYGRAQKLPRVSCANCQTEKRLELHHVDKDPTNNDPSNVIYLCQSCHKAWHFDGTQIVFLDEVVSIEPYGVEPTYDIEMLTEPHNFVGDGIVMHNSQESTRYANYSKTKFGSEITVIDISAHVTPEQYQVWERAMVQAEQAYLELLRLGAKPQIARSVLPTSTKTEIVITGNMRSWRHFFRLRTAKTAHPQIREIATPLCREFRARIPVLFDGFDPVD